MRLIIYRLATYERHLHNSSRHPFIWMRLIRFVIIVLETLVQFNILKLIFLCLITQIRIFIAENG